MGEHHQGEETDQYPAANTDEALRLVPPRQFGLEQAMEFINDDELVK